VNQQLPVICRKKLQAEMTKIFGEKIKELPTQLQEILLDDLVTAFENRLTIFKREEERIQ